MASGRPQNLVFTLFGEYLAHLDHPVWVGSLIALLRPFRLSEGAVRTVLSRMARKRWLTVRKSGRNAYYALSSRGRRVVSDSQDRIFHPPHQPDWNGRWSLVTYSIPEDVRHLRDRLRTRLAWLGFGSLGNGIWLSPHDVHGPVTAMAADMGLEGKLMCFDAHQVGEADHSALVERCWDLPRLAAGYEAFLSRWRVELEVCTDALRAGALRDEDAYVKRFHLIDQFKDFPLEDPFLPYSLLPPGWPGDEAGRLVSDLHDLLEAPAHRYVESVVALAPPFRGRMRLASV